MKKNIIIAFLFFSVNNGLLAQNFLNYSLVNIKEYLSSDLNIEYSEKMVQPDEIEIQYNFKEDPYKVYMIYLKKVEDQSFLCFHETVIMPYSQEILDIMWKHFEGLGYVKTNYKTKNGFPVFTPKKDSIEGITKHYLVFYIIDGEDENEVYLLLDWVLSTKEFILKN